MRRFTNSEGVCQFCEIEKEVYIEYDGDFKLVRCCFCHKVRCRIPREKNLTEERIL